MINNKLYNTLVCNMVIPMESKTNIDFTGGIRKIGGSYYLLLRPKLIDYLDVEEDDEMKIQPEQSDHGKYISAWSTDQQKQNNVDGAHDN